ncbi:spoIIIJ-associated protein [Raineyella antarctica]|uniref:SpoIIIJ-associated protein n=1 Tax=Raineyella antarctica TaxID=1577474 RepID=A0A1G6HTH9_9ACTN|nr:R3H domain-containing nucleic acid-binding protein [Raineyella antarctica]SDB97599.1 spoIIIJ-associated protein [Raineyella antarctica]
MSDNDITAEVVEPAADEAGTDEVRSAPAEDAALTEPSDAAGDDTDAGDDTEADEAGDDEASEDDEGPLDLEGEVAADYLEELLDIADLDGDIDTYVESGRAHVSILTDSDVLIGRDGEVLEALQELTRLAVLVDTGHRSRLMLDIGGHRERRRVILQELAADAIEEVKQTGEPVRLSPMNPFERKIVHDAVAAAGLFSESEGEEPQRRVVVMAED